MTIGPASSLCGQRPALSLDAEQRDLVLAEKQLSVTPKLDQLPVYVRGGSILPIAPLTQSTAEVPSGPLTLRVYPLDPSLKIAGEGCEGEVYSDDGHTFAFRQGAYARIQFTMHYGVRRLGEGERRETRRLRGNPGGGRTGSKWWDGRLNKSAGRWMAVVFRSRRRTGGGGFRWARMGMQKRSSYVRYQAASSRYTLSRRSQQTVSWWNWQRSLGIPVP